MASFNMNTIIAGAIGLLVVAIVMTLAPSLGDDVQTAIGVPSAGSDWDSTNVSTTGADVYQSNASILSIVILITFIGYALVKLRGMQNE